MSNRKNLDELNTLIDSTFIDNTTGSITPEQARATFKDIALSVNPFQTYTGHGHYRDSANISSKVALVQNTPTVFTNDKGGLIVEQLPTSYANLSGYGYYDMIANKIIFDDVDAQFMIEISYKFTGAQADSITRVKVNIDNGGTEFSGSNITAKKEITGSIASEDTFSFTFPVYLDALRLTNGLKVVIESTDTSLEIWDKVINVIRVN